MDYFDEDGYWERRREKLEVSGYYRGGFQDIEPECQKKLIFLDEEKEEIETASGYLMPELLETDLLDILEVLKGIVAEKAIWRPELDAIEYTVYM